MTRQTKPLVEATSRAFEVLSRELGPSDTIRFINQFGAGFGNYAGEPGRVSAGSSTTATRELPPLTRPGSPRVNSRRLRDRARHARTPGANATGLATRELPALTRPGSPIKTVSLDPPLGADCHFCQPGIKKFVAKILTHLEARRPPCERPRRGGLGQAPRGRTQGVAEPLGRC